MNANKGPFVRREETKRSFVSRAFDQSDQGIPPIKGKGVVPGKSCI